MHLDLIAIYVFKLFLHTMVQNQIFIKDKFKFHIHPFSLDFVTDKKKKKNSILQFTPLFCKIRPQSLFCWCCKILALQYPWATYAQLCWRWNQTIWLSSVPTHIGCGWFCFWKILCREADEHSQMRCGYSNLETPTRVGICQLQAVLNLFS